MKIDIKESEIISVKKVVGTQVTGEIYEKLKAEAENDFMSISDLLRKIIFLHYKNQDN